MNQGYTTNQVTGGDYHDSYYHDSGNRYQHQWSNKETCDDRYNDPSSPNYYYDESTNDTTQFDEYYGDDGAVNPEYPDMQRSYESYKDQYCQASSTALDDTASLFYPTHPPLAIHRIGP